jgi:thioredoxin 1
MVNELNEKTYQSTIKSNEGLALVKFFAEWCGYCKEYGPTFESASDKFKDIKFYSVNVDKNSKLTDEMGVEGLPTTVFYRGNAVLDKADGVLSEKELTEKIQKYTSSK